jgi:hypothetical protein
MIAAETANTVRCALTSGDVKAEDLLPKDYFVPYRPYIDPKIAQIEAAIPALEALQGFGQ